MGKDGTVVIFDLVVCPECIGKAAMAEFREVCVSKLKCQLCGVEGKVFVYGVLRDKEPGKAVVAASERMLAEWAGFSHEEQVRRSRWLARDKVVAGW